MIAVRGRILSPQNQRANVNVCTETDATLGGATEDVSPIMRIVSDAPFRSGRVGRDERVSGRYMATGVPRTSLKHEVP
jgi:hypothetical protein